MKSMAEKSLDAQVRLLLNVIDQSFENKAWHALGGEQDLRKMGGLKGKIRTTWWTMLVGTVAIAGFPPLAGFFSKDEILWQAWPNRKWE